MNRLIEFESVVKPSFVYLTKCIIFVTPNLKGLSLLIECVIVFTGKQTYVVFLYFCHSMACYSGESQSTKMLTDFIFFEYHCTKLC